MTTGLQQYFDRAVKVLEHYGLQPVAGEEESRLASLLQDVVHVDEPRVSAVARTLQYMSSFNELVRKHVEDVRIAARYAQITELFNSIRDDSKTLVAQMADGKIDLKERTQNLWMKLTRGSPHARFQKISSLYQDVTADTKEQLDRETSVIEAYIDFRFSLKEAETLTHEVLKTQEGIKKKADEAMEQAQATLAAYTGEDPVEKSNLELKRDEAARVARQEDQRYQLLKDVTENLSIGYHVGETLVAKLHQTHEVKDRVYKRAIAFFTTNEHVFTIMDAVYTAQHGLHEATQTVEAMTEGANKGLEDIAGLGRDLEKAALKAGYGSTIKAESVQKLVEAVVAYQTESVALIDQLRQESEQNTKEIARIVNEGKQRCLEVAHKYTPTAA